MRMKTILALALLCAAPLFAQKQTPPAPGTPRNFSVPAIQRFQLPNGLNVRFVQYGEVPKVTVRLVTLTGNVDEGPEEVWLADTAGSMMEQGTTTRPAEQIARDIAMMGGSIGITVRTSQTTIGTDVFSESVAPAITLVADVARNPLFPESELARIKADLVRKLSLARSQPGQLAAEKFTSVVFPNHPYGRYFPTETMLQSYTIDKVRAFHDRNFGAARSYVYVVGRFDAAAAEKAVRDAFGGWKAGTPAPEPNVSPFAARNIYLIDRPGAVQSTLYIGLPVIDPTSPDFVPLTVMDALLGGSFGSRITSNIREQKGYTYSPRSMVSPRPGAGTWAEMADVTTNVTGASIKEILGEIERLRNEPPTAEELKGIQNYLAGTFVLQNSSRPGIAAILAMLDMYGLSEDYLRTYVQRVYALTPADVQRLAKTYIDPSKLAIVVVGDRAQVLKQLEPYGTIVQ